MFFKVRRISAKLRILRILNKRMELPEDSKQYLTSLNKGYEGEVMFDSLTKDLQCENYILNDLLLKVNNTMFQIDSLLITQHTLFPFDVKNFEGDYFCDSDKLFTKSKYEVTNPVPQLKRCETLFRQFLQTQRISFPIDSKVVYINPEFTLYQAPMNDPIILPTQVKKHLKKFDTIPSKLNDKHKRLADTLLAHHIEEFTYSQLPPYHYEEIRKGLTCEVCDSFEIFVDGRRCVCGKCGHVEKDELALLRNIEEYILLFPDRKITTIEMYNWCNGSLSMKRIHTILLKNFKAIGSHQWTYYVRK